MKHLMKRLLCLALMAALLLPAMPAGAETKETYSAIYATVRAPIPGEKPSFTAQLPAGVYYYVNTNIDKANGQNWYNKGISWADVTSGETLMSPDGQAFAANHKYRLRIAIVTPDHLSGDPPYRFVRNSELKAYINGNAATILNSDSTTAFIEYVFTCGGPVANVAVSGITAPQVGAKPVYSASVDTQGCSVYSYTGKGYKNGVIWWKYDVYGNAEEMAESDTFEAGYKYRVGVFVKAGTGYSFVQEADSGNTAASVNGRNADTWPISASNKEAYIGVMYVFDLRNIISTVEITSPECTPYAGETPLYDGFVAVDGQYYVTSNTSGIWKNGVSWRDATAGENITPDTEFIEGHQYQVFIWTHIRPKYAFKTENGLSRVDTIFNGQKASKTNISTHPSTDYCFVAYTFPPAGKHDIKLMISTVDAEGKHIDQQGGDVILSADKAAVGDMIEFTIATKMGYQLDSVVYGDGEAGIALAPPDSFIVEKDKYQLDVLFRRKSPNAVMVTGGHAVLAGDEQNTILGAVEGDTVQIIRDTPPAGKYVSNLMLQFSPDDVTTVGTDSFIMPDHDVEVTVPVLDQKPLVLDFTAESTTTSWDEFRWLDEQGFSGSVDLDKDGTPDYSIQLINDQGVAERLQTCSVSEKRQLVFPGKEYSPVTFVFPKICAVTVDLNGGSIQAASDVPLPTQITAGETITVAQGGVKAPQYGEFAGYEINGEQAAPGAVYKAEKDLAVKYLWKITPPTDTPTPPAEDRMPGDVTGDGKVDIMDVIRLLKKVSGWSVSIVEKNADVTGDGNINIMDVIRLLKAVSGWEVELK